MANKLCCCCCCSAYITDRLKISSDVSDKTLATHYRQTVTVHTTQFQHQVSQSKAMVVFTILDYDVLGQEVINVCAVFVTYLICGDY